MQYLIKHGNWATQRSDCFIVGIFESSVLSEPAKQLNSISQGYLNKLLKRGDITGQLGQTLLLHDVPHVAAERVLLVGCGLEKEFSGQQFRKILERTMASLKCLDINDAVCSLTELVIAEQDSYWKVRQAVERSEDVFYVFDRLKSKKGPKQKIRKIIFTCATKADAEQGESAVRDGLAITEGMRLVKDLANLPANLCTPSYLAQQAQALAKHYPQVRTKVLDETAMKKNKMGALLSVAQGSHQAAKLAVVEYQHPKKKIAKPIVLVGKGVTFDSGGTSLKSAPGMDEMKYDMCGAATVLGVVKAVAELRLPLHVVGVMPLTENMPGGSATRPGDIVTTMSGQTVEILNTDAEGRLILCDALTYSERFKPHVVIDIATLTGAMIIALGNHASGLFSNHEPLAKDLLAASHYSHDRLWQFPLWEEYQEQLCSNFADMTNVGGKEAGSITAASFLARFTKKFHWAHLDIAGTAWRSGKDKGATGRPVPLLVQYLLDQCS